MQIVGVECLIFVHGGGNLGKGRPTVVYDVQGRFQNHLALSLLMVVLQ